MYIYIDICMHKCKLENAHIHTRTCICIYIYINMIGPGTIYEQIQEWGMASKIGNDGTDEIGSS